MSLMLAWTWIVVAAQAEPVDVVIYGATSGGIVAAAQARLMGKSVLLLEPSEQLGGLTTGGLGATDIGNKAVIGGLARRFYHRIWMYYRDEKQWKHEKREAYQSRRQAPGEETMWTFEPSAADRVMRDILTEAGVQPRIQARLKRPGGVTKVDGRITQLNLESGDSIVGKMFIDATYEGDLMAEAGVSFHVGRESNATYGETLNGVQVGNAKHHQFVKPVDPYVKPGDPSSGLLPGVIAGPPAPDGSGDHRVQTYNFRLCATDVPSNRRPWPKPANYDPQRYELLLRNFEAGDHRSPWNPILMPNRKTDANNNFAFSTDNIGMNYDYPNGDYLTRAHIWQEHIDYQQGLMWTLANSPRVPDKIRREFQTWGLAKDEFVSTDNWPNQLYVREARRMIGAMVMSEHECRGTRVAADSVGMGAYNMDSHNAQRYVDANGHARNEGDVQVGVRPYPISYRALTPKAEHCKNLLVPVCLSATHIAYGSIRMEPVFMVLGQSAATAACLALDAGVAVQDLDYPSLRSRLAADGQVLEYTPPPGSAAAPGLDPKKLAGVVMDDDAAKYQGEWTVSRSVRPFVGDGYRHDNNEGGAKSALFRLVATHAGDHHVRLAYTANANRGNRVLVEVSHGGGTERFRVDQRARPMGDGLWHSLTKTTLNVGAAVEVVVHAADAGGFVVVDAAQLLPVATGRATPGE